MYKYSTIFGIVRYDFARGPIQFSNGNKMKSTALGSSPGRLVLIAMHAMEQ